MEEPPAGQPLQGVDVSPSANGTDSVPDFSSVLAGMGDLLGNLKRRQKELTRRVSPISSKPHRHSRKTKQGKLQMSRKRAADKSHANETAVVKSIPTGGGSLGTLPPTSPKTVSVPADGEHDDPNNYPQDDPLADPALLRAKAICAALGTLNTATVGIVTDTDAVISSIQPSTSSSPSTAATAVTATDRSPTRSQEASSEVSGTALSFSTIPVRTSPSGARAPESLISKGLRKSKYQRAKVSKVTIRSKRAGKGGISPTGDAKGLSAVEQDEESQRLIALAKSLCASDTPKRQPRRAPVSHYRVQRAKQTPQNDEVARRRKVAAAAKHKTLKELSTELAVQPGPNASSPGVEKPRSGRVTRDGVRQKTVNISKQYLIERKRREREAAEKSPSNSQKEAELAAARAREQEKYRAKLKAKIARERRAAAEKLREQRHEEEQAAIAKAQAASMRAERDRRNVEVSMLG